MRASTLGDLSSLRTARRLPRLSDMGFMRGRVERTPELKIHLIEEVDPICGATVYVPDWQVDWIGGGFPSIDDYLIAPREGEVGPPSCMRCCLSLRRFQEQDS